MGRAPIWPLVSATRVGKGVKGSFSGSEVVPSSPITGERSLTLTVPSGPILLRTESQRTWTEGVRDRRRGTSRPLTDVESWVDPLHDLPSTVPKTETPQDVSLQEWFQCLVDGLYPTIPSDSTECLT